MKYVKWLIITLYTLTSTVSIIHLYDFFISVDGNITLSVLLSLVFVLGTAASILVMFSNHSMNRMALMLFILLILIESFGNVFYSFNHVSNVVVESFSQLFALNESLTIETRKRIFSLVHGLPIVILGAGYIHIISRGNTTTVIDDVNTTKINNIDKNPIVIDIINDGVKSNIANMDIKSINNINRSVNVVSNITLDKLPTLIKFNIINDGVDSNVANIRYESVVKKKKRKVGRPRKSTTKRITLKK